METYSSGEELVIKTRKPYTITKQRERWTEEEHNRFLEALKLYGRAWQRIEEHIGTKTAVQIRSHAQKFFSKLEKEAVAKGLPVGQALDIDIPPPRPKRKPNNPYPRKTGTMASACQVDAKDGKSVVLATSCGKQVLKLEKEPERSNGEKKPTSSRDAHNMSHSEAVTLLHVANCSSELSVNINSCTFKEFIPPLMQIAQESDTRNASNSTSSCIMHEKPVPEEKKDGSDSGLPPTEVQVIQNHPRHIPVHVLDGNLAVCGQVIHPGGQIQNSTFHPLAAQGEQLNLFADPAVSVTTEHQNNAPRNQTYPTFHPPCAVMCPDPEEYQSFLQASSASSSLIVSTLLQNPAAYSAASFAASFFPYAYKGSSTDSPECGQEGFQPKQVGSTRSMAAIAAATVAAATAWWVAHGLLCVCAPMRSPFPCPPTSDPLIQPMDIVQVQGGKEHGDHGAYQNPPTTTELSDPEQSAAFEARHSPSKSQTSLLVSQGCGDIKLHDETKTVDHNNALVENAFHDANKSKGRKQADRSSCGSNTASSSDVETDTFKENETGQEVPKKVDDLPMSESSNRRSRSTSNMGDSWKEVSEGGRLAFQALFSREVLPQSFSPEHNRKNKDHHNKNVEENGQTKSKNNVDAVAMDLNSRTNVSSHNQGFEKHALTIGETNPDEGLLTMGLGHVRLKGRRTGFKPYNRCSVESKEKRVASIGGEDEGKGHKKIRLEEEAST